LELGGWQAVNSNRKKSKFLGKEIIDKFINNSNLKRRYN